MSVKPLTSIGIVARHELTDSVRSMRALVMIVLYLAGSIAATWGFLIILREYESILQQQIGLKPSGTTGGVTAALWKSQSFRDLLTSLVKDQELAKSLLNIPPLGLFYGWLSFAFAPIFVMLASASRISEEVSSGSARFVLFRSSRFSWIMGKFLGQAGLLMLALLMSAAGAWCVGWYRMAYFEPWLTAQAMFLFALKAWIYALAFLGVATAISQLCSSPNLAQALGYVALIAMSALNAAASYFSGSGWRRACDLVEMLLPQGHRLDLWRPDMAHMVSAGVFLLALSFAYLSVGYAFFSRKNL